MLTGNYSGCAQHPTKLCSEGESFSNATHQVKDRVSGVTSIHRNFTVQVPGSGIRRSCWEKPRREPPAPSWYSPGLEWRYQQSLLCHIGQACDRFGWQHHHPGTNIQDIWAQVGDHQASSWTQAKWPYPRAEYPIGLGDYCHHHLQNVSPRKCLGQEKLGQSWASSWRGQREGAEKKWSKQTTELMNSNKTLVSVVMCFLKKALVSDVFRIDNLKGNKNCSAASANIGPPRPKGLLNSTPSWAGDLILKLKAKVDDMNDRLGRLSSQSKRASIKFGGLGFESLAKAVPWLEENIPRGFFCRDSKPSHGPGTCSGKEISLANTGW
jgi:hypothetical protein